MDEIRKKVDDEIEACLNVLSAISPDDEKYQDVLDRLSDLYKLRLEEERIEIERDEKESRRMMDSENRLEERLSEDRMKQEEIEADAKKHAAEMELKERQFKQEKRAFRGNLIIAGIGILIPIGVDVVMYFTGLNFEKTGTVTSNFFRMMLNSKFGKRRK